MSRVRRAVYKKDLETGEIIKRYAMITTAALENYCSGGSITKACQGKLRNVGGFGWEYADSRSV